MVDNLKNIIMQRNTLLLEAKVTDLKKKPQ